MSFEKFILFFYNLINFMFKRFNKESIINEKSLDLQMAEAYNEGMSP